MSVTTAQALIFQHPTNPTRIIRYVTMADKAWARSYSPIKTIIVRSFVGADGITYAEFDDALFPLLEDDYLRMMQPAMPPNPRHWKLETEADIKNWFSIEIVSVVLSAWFSYPPMTHSCHRKPVLDVQVSENVDSTFSVYMDNYGSPVAIGEMKRHLVAPDRWQRGDVPKSMSQKKLSRELRGYAHKYQCPQVFCFDGSNLLLLQFRASKAEDIEDENCPVDCWIIPMSNSACTMRYALYRLLTQGWRRCQAAHYAHLTVGGVAMNSRQFFSGQPIWEHQGTMYQVHPRGYQRSADVATGALKWTHPEMADEAVWETGRFW